MSDLERRLRDFPAEFPRPDEDVTRRVRERLPKTRRRAPRRAIALVAAMVAAGALVGSVVATQFAPAAPGDPTIFARVFKRGPSTFVELSGRIPTGASNEVVQILDRDCTATQPRIATEVRTQAAGFWMLEPKPFSSSISYAARWNGRTSDEVTLRTSMFLLVFPLGNRRWRIQVGTPQQRMNGRVVVLQRRTGAGTWVGLRRLRFVHGRFQGLYEAVVRVRTRRLTLRAFVPESSARPCYDPEASAPFRS